MLKTCIPFSTLQWFYIQDIQESMRPVSMVFQVRLFFICPPVKARTLNKQCPKVDVVFLLIQFEQSGGARPQNSSFRRFLACPLALDIITMRAFRFVGKLTFECTSEVSIRIHVPSSWHIPRGKLHSKCIAWHPRPKTRFVPRFSNRIQDAPFCMCMDQWFGGCLGEDWEPCIS